MRTIKFCGYSIDNSTDELLGDWIYGDLNTYPNGDVYITEKSDGVELSYPVEADSIGEFSGKLDCNGLEIYEKDLVAFVREDGTYDSTFEVTFKDSSFCMNDKPMPSQDMINLSRLSVVGNSYLSKLENKEL